MLQNIAAKGSFAAAARSLGLTPSALTYSVRQIEDALDVLLFHRSSRQAQLTVAGNELLREAGQLLEDIDAVANRVKRVAIGWEPQMTIAVDSIIAKATVMELCEGVFALQPQTRIRLRDETLSGTLQALSSGQADLALGVTADSITRGSALTIGLLGGQDVSTIASMQAKLDAQLRGLGCGFVPECMARAYIETGRLVTRRMERPQRHHAGQLRLAQRNPIRPGPGADLVANPA